MKLSGTHIQIRDLLGVYILNLINKTWSV